VLRQYRAMEKAANAALDGPFGELRPLLRDQADLPADGA
jgi:hypothetical protein